MFLSVVIPAYNESKKIRSDIQAALQYLNDKSFSSEIIVVNDGSEDKTADVVTQTINETQSSVELRLISYPQNRGKGYATRHGILNARGERIAFVDAGLCVPYSFLDAGLQALEKGGDFAIASRKLAGTKIQVAQPLHRQWGSRVFGVVVRSLMGVNFVSDTQCGFKVYKASAARAIFSRVQTDGFMFDVEALLIAKQLGLKPAEFAVDWSNDEDTRYDPVWGTVKNFRELAQISARRFRNIRPKARSAGAKV